MKKSRSESLPPLPLVLESGSRPGRSGGPTHLHNVPPHSAVCRAGRGTGKPVGCGRSDYQSLTPVRDSNKMLGHEVCDNSVNLSAHLSVSDMFNLQEALHWDCGFFFDVIVDLRLLQHKDGGQTGGVLGEGFVFFLEKRLFLLQENLKSVHYLINPNVSDIWQTFNCIPYDCKLNNLNSWLVKKMLLWFVFTTMLPSLTHAE